MDGRGKAYLWTASNKDSEEPSMYATKGIDSQSAANKGEVVFGGG